MKDAHRYWVDQAKQERDRTELPKRELMKMKPLTKKAVKWAHVVPNPQGDCQFSTSAENEKGIQYILNKTSGWDNNFGGAIKHMVARQPPFN